MVKKLKQLAGKQAASPTGLFDTALAGQVKESAQQIWLAGMGAFARAQAEGGKVFETLVKEGLSLQKKTQAATEDKLGEVAGKVTSMAGDVQARAGQHWDKLETLFEDRTAKALRKLGVPSAKDIDKLTARIDELSAKLAKATKPVAKKSAATKTPTKAARPAKAEPAKRSAPRRTAA